MTREELKWIRERPTKPGYYWARFPAGHDEPVYLGKFFNTDKLVVYVLGDEQQIDPDDPDSDGRVPTEWYGPIEPPRRN